MANDTFTGNEFSGVKYSEQKMQNFAMGQGGFDSLASAATFTPESGYVWTALMVDTDAQFSAVQATPINGETMDALPDASRDAGRIVYGRFTSVTVTSGTLIAYRATVK